MGITYIYIAIIVIFILLSVVSLIFMLIQYRADRILLELPPNAATRFIDKISPLKKK